MGYFATLRAAETVKIAYRELRHGQTFVFDVDGHGPCVRRGGNHYTYTVGGSADAHWCEVCPEDQSLMVRVLR